VSCTAVPEPPCEAPPSLPSETNPKRDSVVEKWLGDNLTAIAFAVVLAALALRMFVATGTYLNPDEALHYILINQPSAFLAYKASLTNAHPPLLYMVIYFWHFLGRSELMLRMPSVLAGAAFCWFVFKWIESLFGKAAGIISLMVVAFCPALVNISAEVRQYSPLLVCAAAALYFLEVAFQETSVRRMWCFSVALYLAILSHYSAVFLAGALGLYALVRIADSKPPRRFLVAWASGQAGALAIYGFLYVTHVSKIKSSIEAWDQPFYGAQFHSQNVDLADFTTTQTSTIFYYLFQQPRVSQAMLLLFLAGVVFLFVRGLSPGRASSRHFAILLFLPFLAIWGAGVAGIYAYLGSRHTIVLAPFAIGAASFLLASAANHRLWISIPLAVVLMGASNVSGAPPQPYIARQDQQKALMLAAVKDMQQSIPPHHLILVDLQSSLLARYYLCDPKVITPVDESSHAGFTSFACGHPIVSLDDHYWRLTTGSFATQFEKAARAYGLRPGDRIWVFQSGWGANLDEKLLEYFPKFRCLTSKRYGANIVVIPFVVSSDFSPAVPVENCGN